MIRYDIVDDRDESLLLFVNSALLDPVFLPGSGRDITVLFRIFTDDVPAPGLFARPERIFVLLVRLPNVNPVLFMVDSRLTILLEDVLEIDRFDWLILPDDDKNDL